MVGTTTGTTTAATSILREDLHALREDLDLIFNSGQLHSGLAALTNVYFRYFLENMFLSGLFICPPRSVWNKSFSYVTSETWLPGFLLLKFQILFRQIPEQ